MLIIKFDKAVEGIKKGGLGIGQKMHRFEVSLKSLNTEQKRQLIKLLGSEAETFLNVREYTTRICICPEDVEDYPLGSIPTFDCTDLTEFKIMSEKDLTETEKIKLGRLEQILEKCA